MPIIMSQCMVCAHWEDGNVCTAFPNGIPHAVLYNEEDHRQSLPDDNDVQWAPIPKTGVVHPFAFSDVRPEVEEAEE